MALQTSNSGAVTLRGADLSVRAEGSEKLLRIQVVPIGQKVGTRYGLLDFDQAFADALLRNFARLKARGARVPLDYDHGSNAPQTPEQGIAAGWVRFGSAAS